MKVRDVIDMRGNLISREVISTDEKLDIIPLITFYVDQLLRGEKDNENNKHQD